MGLLSVTSGHSVEGVGDGVYPEGAIVAVGVVGVEDLEVAGFGHGATNRVEEVPRHEVFGQQS